MTTRSMQMPKMQYPTGYEGEQRRIEMRRRLAQAMLEKGLSGGDTRSWTQALAQVAQTYAGKRMEKKATDREADMYERMRADIATKMADFQAARNSGATNQDLVDRFGADPMLQDAIDPHRDAVVSAMKNQEELVENGGRFVRKGDFVGPNGKDLAGKPTDLVIAKDGQWQVNPVAVTARLLSNPQPAGSTAHDLTGQMPNPYSTGGGQSSAGPAGGAMPSGGQSPSVGGMDLSKLNPEEQAILQQEIQRRAGLSPEARNMPQGNPLTPPPSQVGPDGKPYWSIGGKWYDNPEGR